MTSKSIIIIGAGLAGLSAGCYARMNGYQVRIFELHNLPGGVCTHWKRKGFIIDGCIHFLMGCKPNSSMYQLYQELGVLKSNQLKPRKGFNSYFSEGTGKRIIVTGDLDKLARDMKELAPEDEKIIDEIIQGCRAMQDFDMGIPKPLELTGFLDNIKMIWNMRRHFKYISRYNIPVEEFVQKIQNLFLREFIYYLFLPQMPLVILFIFLGQLSAGQLGYIEGGSQKFSQSIAERFQELGGEITFGAEVQEIIVENNCAKGIRLADGSEHRADRIVSAADGYSTIFKMLQGHYLDQSIHNRFKNWPLFSSIITVSFGVDGHFPDQPHSQSIIFKEPKRFSGQKVSGFMARIFDYDPSLAPEGKSVVQVFFEADFDYWMNLQQDRTRYEAEKDDIAKTVAAKLDSLLPDFASRVEMTDVATPYTYWRYTRNYRGAYEGWLMTPEMIKTKLPKILPGLANFYMAGQWVEPGGGIFPALYSGRNVIEIICKKDGKKLEVINP